MQWCISRHEQQSITLAQRQRQRFRETKQKFAAWRCAPAFYETEMTCRDVGFSSKVELAKAASSTPVAQKIANSGAVQSHGGILFGLGRQYHYLTGNRMAPTYLSFFLHKEGDAR
jgi:hypothetical protein